MTIRKPGKDMLDTGTSADQLLALDGSARIPAVDGSLLTGLSGSTDTVARTNLALNFFNDSVNGAIDRLAIENGWVDQLEDLSDIDNGAVEIQMAKMDGSVDGFNVASGTLGISDGKSFLMSIWHDLTGTTDGTQFQYLATDGNYFNVYRNTSNEIQIALRNPSNTVIADVQSTNTITASDGLVHVLIEIDMASTTIRIRLNGGAVETNQVTTAIANDTINAAVTTTYVGVSNAATSEVAGSWGQVYLAEEIIDISQASNLALFIDTDGNPVDLGSDGSTPTGTAARLFLNDGILTGVNAGSGGNLTVVGEPVDAGTITAGSSDLDYDSSGDTVTNAYEIVDSYGKENVSTFSTLYSTGAQRRGQCLAIAADQWITKVAFSMNKNASPTGNMAVDIMGISNTLGSTATGDDDIIATSEAIDVSTLTTSFAIITFTFPEPVFLAAGNYHIAPHYVGGDGSNYLNIEIDSTTPSDSGNMAHWTTSGWTATAGTDVIYYLYGLKNLDMITVGSDDIGNSPSSAPTTGHLQVIATEQPAAGNSEWSDTLDTDEAGKSNVSYRQVILASDITNSAGRIRLTLTGPAATEACEIDNVAIVERSGETANGVTTPTEVLFGGASGIIIPIGGSVVSDWLDFDLDNSKNYLLVADIGSTAASDTIRKITSGGNGYYEQSSVNTYNTAAGPTGSLTASSTAIFSKLETETQQTLDTDIVGQISRDGGSTWDTVALSRTAVQVGGTDMNILEGECTFAATTGTNIVGRIKTANKDKITVHGISPNWVA